MDYGTSVNLQMLHTLFEDAPDPILVVDEGGLIAEANEIASEEFGYSRDELVGQSIEMLLPAVLRERHVAHRSTYLAAPRRRRMGEDLDLRARRKDGSGFSIDVSLSAFETERGRMVVCIARNISYQRATQEALTRAHEQLLHAQKLEAIGQLAGGIAHDFNNVLSVILTRCEMLSEAIADGSQREDLEGIMDAASSARTLTKQLLSFSRKQVVAPDVIDLNQVIVGFSRMLRRAVGEQIEIRIDLDPAAGSIRIDPGQLEQLLLNLVVNARDAMPAGGQLGIATRQVDRGGDPRVPRVALTISDTGSGMSPELQSRIFEPFFTTKSRGHGTGLGLASVYAIVEQNGGAIDVESAPGQGTTFAITLPRAAGPLPARPSPPQAAPAPAQGQTVLLLDDDDQVRTALRALLTRSGYRVLTAATGAEAIETSRQHAGPIEVLLTDVAMPGMSGIEAAREIVAARAMTKVVYMSGYADAPNLSGGVANGTLHFLEKPIARSSLLAKLQQILTAS